MPNIVKLEITESHNPYRTDKFVFETDGCKGKLYDGPYLYPLDEQQVQTILSFAQQTDLAGKLRYHMGLISRDYYVLTFDDGTSITSTGGGLEMTKLLRQLASELGEPVNKDRTENERKERCIINGPNDIMARMCESGKMIGGICSEPQAPEKSEIKPWDCPCCGMTGITDVFCHNCGMTMPK